MGTKEPADPLHGGARRGEAEFLPQRPADRDEPPRANLRIGSCNVTCLTRERLTELLKEAAKLDLEFLCLQETRHRGDVGWVGRAAARSGWRVHLSEAPPRSQVDGRPCPGGTAILWRRCRAKRHRIAAPASVGHRACAVSLDGAIIISVYGPQRFDADWADHMGAWLDGFTEHKAVAIGDWNWREHYYDHLPDGMRPWEGEATTTADTRPDRLVTALPEGVTKTVFVPGVPFHGLIHAELPWPAPARVQATRLTRTALYEPVEANRWGRPLPLEEAACARLAADLEPLAPALPEEAPLEARWRRWHCRAETWLQLAVGAGLCRLARKGERTKGSAPTTRPAACGPSHRPAEPVETRALRRAHRRWAERLRGRPPQLSMSDADHRAWGRLAERTGLEALPLPEDVPSALSRITAYLTYRARGAQKAANRDWARRFTAWTDDLWSPARAALRAPVEPQFDEEGMRETWQQVWCPEGPQADPEAWGRSADAAAVDLPRSAKARDWLPTLEDFTRALRGASGAAGQDGWTATELRLLLDGAPGLVAEAHALWTATSRGAGGLPEGLRDVIWTWRTVGLCKDAEGLTARPISIAGIWTRAWHRALMEALPEVVPTQYCCRHGVSSVTAVADWLRAISDGARAGAELDLSKAFDSLSFGVIRAALERAEVPTAVVETVLAAWHAPRVCEVGGRQAAPIRPARGAPQGDPCAPLTLAAITAPWSPGVPHWEYMDDEGLTTDGAHARRDLEAALGTTRAFHDSAGLVQNESKHQLWDLDQGHTGYVEKLGIRVDPSLAGAPALPRHGWEPTLALVQSLGRLPGSIAVRERLAVGFAKPRYGWAAALLAPPPAAHADALMRAVLRTHCTWWCRGRFWALRATLHPVIGMAMAAFKQAATASLQRSAHLRANLRRHAASLQLDWKEGAAGEDLLAPCATEEDARVLQAAQLATAPEQPEGTFAPGAPGGAHALRLIARVRLLAQARRGRFDYEGMERVDVQAQSFKPFATWLLGLSREDHSLVHIWRGGAARTPSRLASGHGGDARTVPCPWCEAPGASGRHFFAECPRFEELRGQLGAEAAPGAGLPPGWWGAQPRVTAKTGWITLDAAPGALRRGRLQLAVAKMGLEILRALRRLPGGHAPEPEAVGVG